jgi:hypothetical protein
MLKKPIHPVSRMLSTAPVVSPESLKGSEGMGVAAAHVSPPAVGENGVTVAPPPTRQADPGLGAMAIRPLDNRTRESALDRILMFPPLELTPETPGGRLRRYNGTLTSSRNSAWANDSAGLDRQKATGDGKRK